MNNVKIFLVVWSCNFLNFPIWTHDASFQSFFWAFYIGFQKNLIRGSGNWQVLNFRIGFQEFSFYLFFRGRLSLTWICWEVFDLFGVYRLISHVIRPRTIPYCHNRKGKNWNNYINFSDPDGTSTVLVLKKIKEPGIIVPPGSVNKRSKSGPRSLNFCAWIEHGPKIFRWRNWLST